DVVNKAGAFAVTVSGVTDRGHGTRWIRGYLRWLQRTYFHTVRGNGSRCYNSGGPCARSTPGGWRGVDGVGPDGDGDSACGRAGASRAVGSSAAGTTSRSQVCSAVRQERRAPPPPGTNRQ